MMVMISLLIPVVVLALVVLLVAGMKSEIKQGGEDMIKKVYVYLVLFATLMMTIGGSVAAFMAIADIVTPAPYYQTFEEYKQGNIKSEFNKDNVELQKLSEEEILARYQTMAASEKERQINRAKNSLIKSLGWIVIPMPVFLFFQRRLKGMEGL
jgi:Skp family chaperone for outer membrane proteins